MASYGFQVVDTAGKSIQVSADGRPECKTGGVTVNWALVTAVTGSDQTYLDGVVVKIGEKALRYGQVLVPVTATGLYAPYDPAQSNGQELLANGKTFIVNETVREDAIASDHPPVLEGGKVFLDRVIQSGVAVHTLALGPTLAELLAVMPRLRLVRD